VIDLKSSWFSLWATVQKRVALNDRKRLFALTVVIGGVCGLAAVAFHVAVNVVTRFAVDRAGAARGSSWIPWTVAVPTIGGLLAGCLLQYVVPNARGSGVPQVKTAFALVGGRLRLRDSIGKFLISTLQIGTGSSLGVEGPTVQICGGIASTFGRVLRVSAPNLRRLVPVGAAAGIAAAFNAPIAAVTFTIEEIVGNLDQTLLSGVIVAAALAAVVERSVMGARPMFDLPQGYGLEHASSLLLYAVLGLVSAGLSIAFSESLLALRLRFRTLARIPVWGRPAIGGLVTGLLAVAALGLLKTGGITGGGYATLDDALWGRLSVKVLVPLCAMKLVSTVFSYASGGAGGIFAPSLFVGGMAGGAIGALDVALFHHSPDSVGAFALVGMGAVFAGVIRAPITSVLIIIEMTNGYSLILPLMIANMSAYALARHLRPTPIYEALLEQDGIHLQARRPPESRDGITSLAQMPLDERTYSTFSPGVLAGELLESLNGRQEVFPVVSEGRLVGIITVEDLAALASEQEMFEGLVNAADVMRPPLALKPEDDLHAALEAMLSEGVRELPVVDAGGRLIGLVDETAIAHAYVQNRSRAAFAPDPKVAGGARVAAHPRH
jgi:CIC family chloride channel protein